MIGLSECKSMLIYLSNSHDPVLIVAKSIIVGLILFMGIRHLMIGAFFRSIKQMDKEFNRFIRKSYLQRSWIGWLFFVVGMGIYELLLFKTNLLDGILSTECWLLIILLFFVCGIFYQLYFLARAIINIFKKRIEIEKN